MANVPAVTSHRPISEFKLCDFIRISVRPAAARKMRDEKVGSVLVTEGDRLLGIVTDRQITHSVVADGSDPNDVLVGEENEFASILEQLSGTTEAGSDLTLTIDAEAQRLATNLLASAGAPGAVVAIEPDKRSGPSNQERISWTSANGDIAPACPPAPAAR